MASTNLAVFAFLFLSFSAVAMAADADEVEDEREFGYEEGTDTGPEHWGEIHQDWAACGKGQLQSPIDMSHQRVHILPDLGKLRRSYRPARAVMKNRGHDIMIQWEEDAGEIRIDGKEYKLKQLHWHSPSEHTINGRRYEMEVHMVHQSADGKIAVVGIMYMIGRPDPFLTEMEEYIKVMEGLEEGEEEKLGLIDPRHIKRGSRKYYRYLGSLTTPPCTEGVIWTIIKKVRTVSREQVNLLREAVHDGFQVNARPTQLINDRTIGMYRPGKVNK